MAGISAYLFETGREFHTHRHIHGHIIIALEKEFFFRFQNKFSVICPGEIGFIPPDTEHTYRCTGRAIVLNIPAEMVKGADLEYLTRNCVRKISRKTEPIIKLIQYEIVGNRPSSESLRYLFYYLYDKLAEEVELPTVDYIREHYGGDLTVQELAEIENYNVSYYTYLFQKQMGCVPREYIRRVRIEKAKEILLFTRNRVIDVAIQVGYSNPSAFIRVFRESTGMTPMQYRQSR